MIAAMLLLCGCSWLRSTFSGAGQTAPSADAAQQTPATSTTPGAGGTGATARMKAADQAREMAAARAARNDGRWKEASIHLERVIRGDPSAFDARLQLVEILLEQSIELGRAGALLDEAKALRTYDVQVDRLRAWLDELRGDPAAAADDYRRVLAAGPDPELRLRRASLLLRMNRVDDAVAEYEKVASERPADRATRATLAEIYEYQGRDSEAERKLAEIVQLAPGELGPLRRLAAFYRRTGQFTKANDVEAQARALEAPPRPLRPLRPSRR